MWVLAGETEPRTDISVISVPRSSTGPMLVAAGVVLLIAGLLVWAGAFFSPALGRPLAPVVADHGDHPPLPLS